MNFKSISIQSTALREILNIRSLTIASTFFLVLLTASSLSGRHLNLFLDEGIYVHGAERVLQGQTLYRDWFNFVGPGTDWLYALVFSIFGNTLKAAHGLLAFEVALSAASVFMIVSAVGSNWLNAIAASLSWIALLTVFPHRFYINHRWDSLCFASIAVAVMFPSDRQRLILHCLRAKQTYCSIGVVDKQSKR